MTVTIRTRHSGRTGEGGEGRESFEEVGVYYDEELCVWLRGFLITLKFIMLLKGSAAAVKQ